MGSITIRGWDSGFPGEEPRELEDQVLPEPPECPSRPVSAPGSTEGMDSQLSPSYAHPASSEGQRPGARARGWTAESPAEQSAPASPGSTRRGRALAGAPTQQQEIARAAMAQAYIELLQSEGAAGPWRQQTERKLHDRIYWRCAALGMTPKEVALWAMALGNFEEEGAAEVLGIGVPHLRSLLTAVGWPRISRQAVTRLMTRWIWNPSVVIQMAEKLDRRSAELLAERLLNGSPHDPLPPPSAGILTAWSAARSSGASRPWHPSSETAGPARGQLKRPLPGARSSTKQPSPQNSPARPPSSLMQLSARITSSVSSEILAGLKPLRRKSKPGSTGRKHRAS